jgi:hypothetical protein
LLSAGLIAGTLRGTIKYSIMLRITIYPMLIVILTMEAASAQENKPGLPGYTNVLRSPLERNNDKEIDRAYQSTVKTIPNAKKETSDPWGDVRSGPPAPAKGKQ